jgi:flagellar hook-associated protein 3 FlgL
MNVNGPTHSSARILPFVSIRQTQLQLERAQLELSTSRNADVMLELGGAAGRNVNWHANLKQYDDRLQSWKLHAVQADLAQASLRSLGQNASAFASDLIASRGAVQGPAIIRNQATRALSAAENALNAETSGVFLFAGLNRSNQPLSPSGSDAALQQIDTMFQTQFGFVPGDPQAGLLDGTQINSFFTTAMQTVFSSPNWETQITTATQGNVGLHITNATKLELLPNANEVPIKQLYGALAIMSRLSAGQLNSTAFQSVVDLAAETVSSAVQGLADIESRIAVEQKMLLDATAQTEQRKIRLNNAIAKTESVDAYEVATRINQLTTQLEASYSVTTRLARISLLNYL